MDELVGPGTVDVAVVGGGMGGLLAAIEAARAGSASVVVVEPHPLGGRARCDDRSGYRFNRGPRALYVGGPADRALRALGVATRTGGKPGFAAPVAVHGGALHRFPDGPVSMGRTTLLAAREKAAALRGITALATTGPGLPDALSVAAWLDDRRLRGTPRQLIEALIRVATYTDAPQLLPAAPALRTARRAMTTGVRYLDGGFQRLVDELDGAAAAHGVRRLRATATGVVASGDRWEIATDRGTVAAAAVVLATGGPDGAAGLLGGTPASWGPLGPPATVACLELGIRGRPAHGFALGIDEPTYLSQHSPPADLAPEGGSVVHLMRYQGVGDALPAERQEALLRDRADLAGIASGAVEQQRFLARMVVTGALPVAEHGGLPARPAVAVPEHPGAFLVGDWVGHEGLLLDAVAASALVAGRQAAERSATMVHA